MLLLYYTKTVANLVAANPKVDVADIRVDTKLSTLKPLHARSLTRSYKYFNSDPGRKIILSGWRGAGITDAVKKCRDKSVQSLLDPFVRLSI